MLYIRSPELIHLIIENLYSLTNLFPLPQCMVTTLFPWVSLSDSACIWDQDEFVLPYLIYIYTHIYLNIIYGLPWCLNGNESACQTWVWSLGEEDPLEKEMATHSCILAWEITWTEEPGRLQSTGSQVRYNLATKQESNNILYLCVYIYINIFFMHLSIDRLTDTSFPCLGYCK